jgi:hypothetical protein
MVLRQTEGKPVARFFLAAGPGFFAARMRQRAVPSETAAAMVLRKSFREFATQR